MTAIKEKIIGAVTVMSDSDAEKFWEIILNKFAPATWDDIDEEAPDEIDLQMLKEIDNNPDCHEFVKESDINWETPS